MTTMVFATYMSSLFSLFILVVIAFWLYRRLMLDTFRQDMFALRDELFDDAASGKLAFGAPAYGMLRQTMNGMIRFGHRANLPFALALAAFRCPTPQAHAFRQHFEIARRSLDPAQRARIDAYKRQMDVLLLKHLVFGSPLFMLCAVLPLLVIRIVKVRIDRILTLANTPVDQMNAEAYVAGEPH